MTREAVKEIRDKINYALDELDNFTEINLTLDLDTQILYLTCDSITAINNLLSISGSPWKVKRMFPEGVKMRVSFDMLNETTALGVEMTFRGDVELRHVLPVLITMR